MLLAIAAAISASALGGAVAPALMVRATPKKITGTGVGAVTLGKTYSRLRDAGLVGAMGPGCSLAGPKTRTARLRSPLKGGVIFKNDAARRAVDIFVTGGATARGVGVGAPAARIKQAYPKAVAVHSTDLTFGFTLYTVSKSAGGPLTFKVDVTTKQVTIIGIPNVPICD